MSGGKVGFQCNFCNRQNESASQMQKHLRYRCGVANMDGGGRRRKHKGGGVHEIDVYGIPNEVEGAFVPTEDLQRKVWEITGAYDPTMERYQMIQSLQDYAQRHKRDISRWEFEKSLGDVQESIGIGIGVGPGPGVGPSAGEMMKLRQDLAECQSKLSECEKRKGFATVQTQTI